MGKYSDYYCADGNKKLKVMVDRIIRKEFPWLPQKDYDDFYSIAGQTVWYCETRFDEIRNNSFEKYLIDSLKRKIKTQVTHMNRKKRKGDSDDISLDACIEDEEKMTVLDVIADKEVPDITPLTQRYLDSLTKKQRQIAEMIMQGYDVKAIKKTLGLSDDKYEVITTSMREDRKIAPLKKLKGETRWKF